VLALSDFVSDALALHPDWWQGIHQQPPQPEEWQHYADWLSNALADVNDALVGTRETAAQLVAVEQQVTALQTYSLQARRLYEGGYSTYLDVTTSEEKLFDGQLQEVNSRLAALNAFNTLYLAVGGEVGPDASLLFGPIVNR